MRVWLKRIGFICLIPIGLILLVALLFYIPSVQNAVLKKAIAYASDATGMNVGFEKARLSFPLNLSVQNAYVLTSENDTLLVLDKITAEIRFKPLLNGNLSVKGITLESLKLNTGKFIDNMVIKGDIGKVYLNADSILFKKELVLINKFELEDTDINFCYCDTTQKDTTSTELKWIIEVEKIKFNNVNVSCRMPCDSINIDLQIENAALLNGLVDLGKGKYSVLKFNTEITSLFYGKDIDTLKTTGFDPAHIKLSDLSLAVNSVTYNGLNDIKAVLDEFSLNDKSGFSLKNMKGNLVSDSANVSIPSIQLTTGDSEIDFKALIPWDVINGNNTDDTLFIVLNGSIDKRDFSFFIPSSLGNISQVIPDKKLRLSAFIDGNLKKLNINKFDVSMPSYFDMTLKGLVNNVMKDSLRTGNLELAANTQNLDFVTPMMNKELQTRFRIPSDMSLNGDLKMNKGEYIANFLFNEDAGEIRFSGRYNILNGSYEASATIDSLRPVHFMPTDSIMFINGSFEAKGQGTNIFNKRTWSEIKANITDLQYVNYYLTDLSLNADLKDNLLKAKFISNYPLAAGNIVFDGEVKKNDIKGKLTAQIDTLDLKGLNLSDSTLATSFNLFSDLETDLDKKHSLSLVLDNWILTMENQKIRPDTITLDFRSEADTVKARFDAGDLNVSLTGNADLMSLTNRFVKLYKDVMNQLKRDSLIDMQALRPDFPDISLHISADKNNPLYNFLQQDHIFYETFAIDATISPEAGLNADGILLSLVSDTFKIDTVLINIWQDALGLRYSANVLKNRFRNQNPFKASANGFLYNKEADMFVSFINRNGEKGVDLGVNLKKAPEGFDFHLYPEKVVLAFIPFTLNANNYFQFKSIKDMEADLYLKGDDNASFWIHSGETDSSATMKELMVELNQINLEKTIAGFSDFKSLKGIFNATLGYKPTENSFMIMADGNVDSLYYENGRIGEMLLNATYMPIDNKNHQIDFHVFHDFNEIAALSLLYSPGLKEDLLDGIVQIDKLPLKIAEPFLPENMALLEGFLHGDFTIKGTNKQAKINGSFTPDSISIFIVPSSTRLSLENKKIAMTNNILNIDNLKVYSKNNPFVINGKINAVNFDRPTVNLNISASNVQLIDAKKALASMAYGQLSVNLNTTVTGPLQSLRTRGNLNILGNSDFTYVMPGATLEAQDGFSNIVKFTYFADTLPRRVRLPGETFGRSRGASSTTGNDVFLNININPIVWFNIDMDEDEKNYVKLKGGGNLTFQYTPQGDMLLNGRYSLSDGNIKYNIPVIPLTDFSVRNGSYVDWSGDPMNPYLNITAISMIRSMVKFDGNSRMVEFNTGIKISNYLDKMELEFILEAPNDGKVQNQLASMGAEERSKQAISLLVTGVYLASGGTGSDNIDMNAVLSSFLQRELKNLIGSFLGDIPFTFDVLTYDGVFGLSNRIDYIGRLHTKLFNDNFNTTLGLRYSTNDPEHANQLLLDDVTLEYLLDADGSSSVSVFRNKEYKNIFENEIGRYGVGFSRQKKVKTLRDLFLKKRNKQEVKNEEETKNENDNNQ